MRKPVFCICENKGADQLRDNHAADQHLCFCYIDTIPLLHKSKSSILYSSSVAIQPGLFWTWLETPKTGFLATQLIRCSCFQFFAAMVACFFTNFLLSAFHGTPNQLSDPGLVRFNVFSVSWILFLTDPQNQRL